MKNNCVFCAIAAGEIPAHKIYEDESLVAILDAGPLNAGHALIIPREHAADLRGLPDETAAKILPLAKKLTQKMYDELNPDGLNVIQNNGEAAGQSVMHFHLHLIPRYAGDKAVMWGKVLDPKPSGDEYAALSDKLRLAP